MTLKQLEDIITLIISYHNKDYVTGDSEVDSAIRFQNIIDHLKYNNTTLEEFENYVRENFQINVKWFSMEFLDELRSHIRDKKIEDILK